MSLGNQVNGKHIAITARSGDIHAIQTDFTSRDAEGKRLAGSSIKLDAKKENAVCTIECFVAGTLIETSTGLKTIEQLQLGDLIWSREEFGDNYAYRPVVATKSTGNQPLYEVVVADKQGNQERFLTTEQHPFYVRDMGWVKTSSLETGMSLVNRQGIANLEVISQQALAENDTVYNIEVEGFHTYHIGKLGVWVHNDKCCELLPTPKTPLERRNSAGRAYGSTSSLREIKDGESWFNNNDFAEFPKQVADKMFGRTYNNFDEFRTDFWKEVAKDPILSKEFNIQNIKRMSEGKAPFTKQSQHVGERRTFELDHHKEIQDNGLVYDFNNIIIRTPKNHIQKTNSQIIERKNMKNDNKNRLRFLINKLVNGNVSEDEEQKICSEIDLLSIDPLWSDYIFWSDEYLLDDGSVDIDKLINKIT